MPDAAAVLIADDVTARLNAPNTFSQAFTAARAWTVSYALEELTDLMVAVVAMNTTAGEDETRGVRRMDHEVSVGVQQKVDVTSAAAMNAACDPLAYLAQEIADHFVGADVMDAMDAALGVQCVSSSVALCDPMMLREKNVFLSVVTLNFAEWRDR